MKLLRAVPPVRQVLGCEREEVQHECPHDDLQPCIIPEGTQHPLNLCLHCLHRCVLLRLAIDEAEHGGGGLAEGGGSEAGPQKQHGTDEQTLERHRLLCGRHNVVAVELCEALQRAAVKCRPGVCLQHVCGHLSQFEEAPVQHRVQLAGRSRAILPQRQQCRQRTLHRWKHLANDWNLAQGLRIRLETEHHQSPECLQQNQPSLEGEHILLGWRLSRQGSRQALYQGVGVCHPLRPHAFVDLLRHLGKVPLISC
mmetsp:Transcript_4883/g.14040  ORF Transcript_4883/g.14040 Transcript_4883/m.14040 type:complete len:254 (-) Transcript_4883:837-1598(-)